MVSKVDKTIIELLQKDARMPITQIAKEVGMSENGVKYRLDKLEEKGIINRFALLINPKKMDKSVMAIFHLEISPEDIIDTLPRLIKIEEFIKVYHTTGEYSILAIGLFKSNEYLTNFLNNTLLKNYNIDRFSFEIVTKQYKESIYSV